jgi:hypothetical protein
VKRTLSVLACCASAAWLGCSSTLRTVAVTDPAVFHGIRVHTLESYVVRKEVVTQKCAPRTVESIEHLPIGRAYDLGFEPGWFASSQFSVSFTDSGLLKQVTLNTDPQVDETLSAAARLTEPLAGAPSLAAAPACGDVLSETIVEVKPLLAER